MGFAGTIWFGQSLADWLYFWRRSLDACPCVVKKIQSLKLTRCPMLLVSSNQTVSEPFSIPKGGQLTLLATGLAAGETVTVSIVEITGSTPLGDVCCPGPVVLPEVGWSVPLVKTCNCQDTPVVLTAVKPWVVLSEPQLFKLQATVHAATDAIVQVYVEETARD